MGLLRSASVDHGTSQGHSVCREFTANVPRVCRNWTESTYPPQAKLDRRTSCSEPRAVSIRVEPLQSHVYGRAVSEGDRGLRFRVASIFDVIAIVELVERAYRGTSSRLGWTTEEAFLGGQRTDRTQVVELIHAPESKILLAETDRCLVGTVLVRRDEEGGYLGMLAVDPVTQARGVGRQLLAQAEQQLITSFGAAIVRMTVLRQRPELIAWYERRGYHRTGQTSPFPYGDDRFGLPKRDDLEFCVLEKKLR